MSSQGYELQVLLELREGSKKEAEDDLARCVAGLSAAKQEVVALQSKLAQAKDKRRMLREKYDAEAAQPGALVGSMYQAQNYLRGLKADEALIEDEIRKAQENVVSAQQLVTRARKTLIEAATELEAVLAHQKQWKEEQDTLKKRKQSAAMDDIAARIWREKQS